MSTENSLLLKSIVVVVIRMFCITWFVHGVALLADILSVNGFVAKYCMLPLVYLAGAICGWVLAGPLTGLVTRGYNAPVNLGGLTRYDLYCFAFVFLGLSFALAQVALTVTQLYRYWVIISRTMEGDPSRNQAFYAFARYGVTFIAGVIMLIFGPLLAKKLAAREPAVAAPPPPSDGN